MLSKIILVQKTFYNYFNKLKNLFFQEECFSERVKSAFIYRNKLSVHLSNGIIGINARDNEKSRTYLHYVADNFCENMVNGKKNGDWYNWKREMGLDLWMVKLLLKNGANTKIKDCNGQTAYDIVYTNKDYSNNLREEYKKIYEDILDLLNPNFTRKKALKYVYSILRAIFVVSSAVIIGSIINLIFNKLVNHAFDNGKKEIHFNIGSWVINLSASKAPNEIISSDSLENFISQASFLDKLFIRAIQTVNFQR